MSRITPDNLDKWLFNLEEGNLTTSEKRELDQFLSSHPELMEEAEAWKMAHLSEPLVPYAFEAELHAVAQTGTFAYRRYAALVGILLLFGSAAWFFLSGEETETTSTSTTSVDAGESTSFKLFDYDNSHTGSANNESDKNNRSLNKDKKNSSAEESNSAANNTAINEASENNNSGNTQHFSNSNIVNKNSNNKVQKQTNSGGSILYANYHASNNSNNNSQNDNSNSNSKNNPKQRDQVRIDIVNEVKVINETEIIHVTENADSKEDEQNVNDTASKDELPLPLKENPSPTLAVTEATGGSNGCKNCETKSKLQKFIENLVKNNKNNTEPNPTLTNLRDPYLLTTNNNLVDQYGGFAGSIINPRLSANYRNSWTSNREINSQTAVVSYDQLMRKIKTGIAFTGSYNDYSGGMFNTASASMTISPKFKLGRGITLEPFVTGSYSQKTVNLNRATAGMFIEDRRGNVLELYRNGVIPASTKAYSPDMKAGAVFQHKKFWGAVSVDHILTPKEILYSTAEQHMYKNQMEFKTTFGTDYIHRIDGAVFSPQMSILYHDGYSEAWLGLNVRFHQLVLGAAASQFKDVVTMIGFQAPKSNFKMVYQYDMTRSMLFNEKIGSHELSLRFAINGNNKGTKPILNSDK